jgi:hypothetical protein
LSDPTLIVSAPAMEETPIIRITANINVKNFDHILLVNIISPLFLESIFAKGFLPDLKNITSFI